MSHQTNGKVTDDAPGFGEPGRSVVKPQFFGFDAVVSAYASDDLPDLYSSGESCFQFPPLTQRIDKIRASEHPLVVRFLNDLSRHPPHAAQFFPPPQRHAIGNKEAVLFHRLARSLAEEGQHPIHSLPFHGAIPHDDRVSGPYVTVEVIEIVNQSGAQRAGSIAKPVM